MINYLLNFCQLDPWAVDRNGDTFFHLLCHNKKVEAVYYCLKSPLFAGKSVADLRNAAGQNPFDLSLENSTAEIPYLLLSVQQFSLLTPRSREGVIEKGIGQIDDDNENGEKSRVGFDSSSSSRTSKDPSKLIASKAKSNPSFAQLESAITFHRKIARFLRRPDSRPLLGPYPAYLFLILKPFLLAPFLFFVCRRFLARWIDYDGGVFYLIAFYFAWSYKSENYRMNHVSKWPNPFMAALFFSGIFYDLVVFYLAIWPAWDTTPWFDAFLITTTLTLIYQYSKLMLGDPGRAAATSSLSESGVSAREGNVDEKSSLASSDDMNSVAAVYLADHCALCRVRGDAATHVRHCRLCDVCLRGFDHHCLFLLTCVAKNNRRLFLAFLIFVDFVCIPTLLVGIGQHLALNAVASSRPTTLMDDEPTILPMFLAAISASLSNSYLAMLLFLCLGNAIAWTWIAYLIYNQIYYVVRAHTTSCVGIKSCRDELNQKISWRQFSRNLLLFLTKGEVLSRNVMWA